VAALEHSDAVEDLTTVDLAEALDATPGARNQWAAFPARPSGRSL